MELMTKDMHIIALKTKSETVSMRIITLVTLFFLPGTFISVSISATNLFIANQHFPLFSNKLADVGRPL
jgi:hypothetical protein